MIGAARSWTASSPTRSAARLRNQAVASGPFTVTGYPGTTSRSIVAPWVAATPSATCRTQAATDARMGSDTVRIVPSKATDSGMMLFVVPT